MADHNAIEANFLAFGSNVFGTDTTIPEEIFEIMENPVEVAKEGVAVHSPVTIVDNAWEPSNEYPHNVILDKIYFSPYEIDGGFIVDESQHQVRIWNTFSQSKLITDIEEVSPLGTTLTHGEIPITITALSEKFHTLTILKDGPPFQDTNYNYTINGAVFELHIVGKRVLSWTWEPAWNKNITIRYKFLTAMGRNKRFTEQRRPMLSKLIREQSADFLETELQAQKFLNELRRLSLKVLAIPIYSEAIRPIVPQTLQGATLVNVKDTLNDFWNLKNGGTVIVLVKSISGSMNELKEVTSIGASSISFTNAISAAFQAVDTTIYPVMIGIIQSKNVQFETRQLVRANIDFREIL